MTKQITFETVNSSINFPKTELEILDHWKKNDSFRASLRLSSKNKPFSFYDGPPFATGLPHYGHILAGTIKDIVTRFAHQTGHHVERRFGWDTHGLPVEFEIDKKLNIKSRQDVLKLGIGNYNAECRAIVMRYSREWEEMVRRCGRWIDFDHDYKTLDTTYMETVWWVFKTVYSKGLIYRGQKVMPYSPRLGTPLSNFEANLNYKDVSDPSVVVKFPLLEEENTFLLAWTTTPWTLLSHMAVCVRDDTEYSSIEDIKSGEKWIIASNRLDEIYKKPEEEKNYRTNRKFKGSELVGKEYNPPFDYFLRERANGAFRVVSDDYVTDSSGTGLVHQAPGFGEDDYRVCLSNGIIQKGGNIICPLDANCRFTDEVPEFAGLEVAEANRKVIQTLRRRKLLAKESQIRHSYPFCWRSECPLMYRAVPSWFLNVEEIKPQLIENNKKTKWVPKYVQEKRFANWLEDARDWAISRNRFWGTPLPVWANEDYSEIVVVGSIEELETLSGAKGITDLHRENVDQIKIPSQKGGGDLSRVDEVFDCWFESGSMPYAQVHYPFENKEKFEKTFPADFVAEGLDQTRGWFYTMMVLSTALFNKPAFKNLICNGLVLAEDGKKMSKRLKNYPDPKEILEEYGADALRLCLINSPAVRAESIRFTKSSVFDVVKSVLLLWQNTYRFFVENANRFERSNEQRFANDAIEFHPSGNKLDQWITSALMSLISEVRSDMQSYHLYKVPPSLVNFLNQLSLWYVRFNRARMKGQKGPGEALDSLKTLHFVLFSLCRIMSPFTPFIVEKMYQNLKKCLPENSELKTNSVHYLSIPSVSSEALFPGVERAIARMQQVIELGRAARFSKSLKFKQPLSSMIVIHPDEQFLGDVKEFENYIKDDLNLQKIEFSSQTDLYTGFHCLPDRKSLGKRLRKKSLAVCGQIQKLTAEEISKLRAEGNIEILGEKVFLGDVTMEISLKDQSGRFCSASGAGACVVIDAFITKELREECLRREIVTFIQKLKKKADLTPSVEVFVFVETKGKLSEASKINTDKTKSSIGADLMPFDFYEEYLKDYGVIIAEGEETIEGESIKAILVKPALIFAKEFSKRENETAFKYAISRNYKNVLRDLEKDGFLRVPLENGESFIMRRGRDFYLSFNELMSGE